MGNGRKKLIERLALSLNLQCNVIFVKTKNIYLFINVGAASGRSNTLATRANKRNTIGCFCKKLPLNMLANGLLFLHAYLRRVSRCLNAAFHGNVLTQHTRPVLSNCFRGTER